MMRTIAMLMAGALLSGCVVVAGGGHNAEYSTGWQARQSLNRSVIPALEVGAALDDVRGRLGEPEFTEAFTGDDGDYRALFYRTHHVKGDGRTTRDETTPVVFRNGALVGIGDDFYRRLTGG